MKFFKKFLSLQFNYNFLSSLLPWLVYSSVILLLYGLIGGLVLAPADYQQSDGFRIIYIHAPAAFLSLLIYGVMVFFAIIHVVWRIKLSDFAVTAAAPVGFAFTLIALVTGSLWGEPMWGTFWVWDARLTSELILLFIYGAIIALTQALQKAQSPSLLRNIFVLIGGVNLPIIHYSVYWWNSLHQGATLTLVGPSHIAPSMLHPLIAMIFGFILLFGVIWCIRLRNLILWHARKTQWVQQIINNNLY